MLADCVVLIACCLLVIRLVGVSAVGCRFVCGLGCWCRILVLAVAWCLMVVVLVGVVSVCYYIVFNSVG